MKMSNKTFVRKLAQLPHPSLLSHSISRFRCGLRCGFSRASPILPPGKLACFLDSPIRQCGQLAASFLLHREGGGHPNLSESRSKKNFWKIVWEFVFLPDPLNLSESQCLDRGSCIAPTPTLFPSVMYRNDKLYILQILLQMIVEMRVFLSVDTIRSPTPMSALPAAVDSERSEADPRVTVVVPPFCPSPIPHVSKPWCLWRFLFPFLC